MFPVPPPPPPPAPPAPCVRVPRLQVQTKQPQVCASCGTLSHAGLRGRPYAPFNCQWHRGPPSLGWRPNPATLGDVSNDTVSLVVTGAMNSLFSGIKYRPRMGAGRAGLSQSVYSKEHHLGLRGGGLGGDSVLTYQQLTANPDLL